MIFTLTRFAYLNEGTLGRLTFGDVGHREWYYTLERPWVDNHKNVSCIPEGKYRLLPDMEGRGFERGFPELQKVPGRSEILIHPANKIVELQGCIAPGMQYLLGSSITLMGSALAYSHVKAALKFPDEGDWLVVTHMEAVLATARAVAPEAAAAS